MNNRQNTYGQQQMQQEQGMIPPQGPMMPPMPPRPRTWREKEVAMMGKRLFPNWLSLYPMVAYVAALMVVTVIYSSFSMPWYYMMCEER